MTLREHLEAIRDHSDPIYCGCGEHAVAALAILDAAARVGEEDFEWSDTDRLVPDPGASGE